MAIIEGPAYCASLTRPNETFEPMWRFDLAVDVKSAAELQSQVISLGVSTIAEKTIPNIVRLKRKVQKANGDKNTQPQLVDGAKNPLDKRVGNGSKVKVMYKPYEWNFKGKKGMGLYLQAVQVIDLVQYTPREDFFELETPSIGVDIKDDFQSYPPFEMKFNFHFFLLRGGGEKLPLLFFGLN